MSFFEKRLFNSLGSNYNLHFVLKSLFTFGTNSNDLEKLLEEKYVGKALLLYKGREALELAFKILNLPEGSFVAINGFTCFAVYKAVKNVGLKVEYLDIDKGELNFSSETLQKAIERNPQIKAIIVQNTLGYPSDIENISKVCKQNDIYLIEDLAHSLGTFYENGAEAGTVSDLVVLSFSQDKIIDGISGGALIIKNNKNFSEHINNLPFIFMLLDKFYPLFTYLIRNSYSYKVGKVLHFTLKNLRLLSKPMPNIKGLHALPSWYTFLISGQFKELNNNLNHRKTIAALYAKLISPKILSAKLVDKISLSTNLRFPIFIKKRESLIKYLAKHGIFVSDIWYDAPIAPRKYLDQTDYSDQCPNSELASVSILNLPTHRNISENDAMNISNLINQWFKLR